ncbi:hypothetical protein E2C01_035502 [Portunus trituberculatus]|uniref:Uncharacterized protein n=1 Tax=Portunus trituberculatus TaxID=210409 RepID=A0A5B7FBN1_PORTR|nr:hypothetical protein [Portunus trituberculatus]
MNGLWKLKRLMIFKKYLGTSSKVQLSHMMFTLVAFPWLKWPRCWKFTALLAGPLHSMPNTKSHCAMTDMSQLSFEIAVPGKWDVWQANHVYQSIVPPGLERTLRAVRNISLFIFA